MSNQILPTEILSFQWSKDLGELCVSSIHLVPIDEAVNAMLQNSLNFLLHLLFLGPFNFCHFCC